MTNEEKKELTEEEMYEGLLELSEEEAKKKFFEEETKRRIRLCETLAELRFKMIMESGPNVEYIMALGEAIEIFQTDILLFQEEGDE